MHGAIYCGATTERLGDWDFPFSNLTPRHWVKDGALVRLRVVQLWCFIFYGISVAMFWNGRFSCFAFRCSQLAFRSALLTFAIALNCCCCVAQADDGINFFEDRIETVLMDRCYKCHSEESDEPAGGLLLDSKAGIRRGGETGPAVVPEDVDESLLISAIEYRDLEMPPSEKLDDDVIEDFRKWIEMGAPDSRSDDEDDSRTAVQEFTKSILKMPDVADISDEELRKWRDERRKAFEQIYATSPAKVSQSVCKVFGKASAAEILPIAVSVSRFVEIPKTSTGLEESFLTGWAPLRKSQYLTFVESSEFRQRFLRLVVWQLSYVCPKVTEPSSSQDTIVECLDVDARYRDCKKACEGATELLDHQKLNCVMLMGLTSRGDMLEKLKQGASLRTVFLEWSQWFDVTKSQLVQTKDGTGWGPTDASSGGSSAMPFPKLRLPSSPAEDLPPVSASLRKFLVD